MAVRLEITVLDNDGNVVDHHITNQDWAISEIDVYLNSAKSKLYLGEIGHIMLNRWEDENELEEK